MFEMYFRTMKVMMNAETQQKRSKTIRPPIAITNPIQTEVTT